MRRATAGAAARARVSRRQEKVMGSRASSSGRAATRTASRSAKMYYSE